MGDASPNRVLGVYEASTGGLHGIIVDPKLVFSVALKAAAFGIVLCHNHPSVEETPSEENLKMTGKLKSAGELLEITILDHLIITSEGYTSLADEDLMKTTIS